jgi:hypothetical protein
VIDIFFPSFFQSGFVLFDQNKLLLIVR